MTATTCRAWTQERGVLAQCGEPATDPVLIPGVNVLIQPVMRECWYCAEHAQAQIDSVKGARRGVRA